MATKHSASCCTTTTGEVTYSLRMFYNEYNMKMKPKYIFFNLTA